MNAELFIQSLALIPKITKERIGIDLGNQFDRIQSRQYSAIAAWMKYHLLKEYDLRILIKQHYQDYEGLADRILAALHLLEKVHIYFPAIQPLEYLFLCELYENIQSFHDLIAGKIPSKRRTISSSTALIKLMESDSAPIRSSLNDFPSYQKLEASAQKLSKNNLSPEPWMAYCRELKRCSQKIKKSNLNRFYLSDDGDIYIKEPKGRIKFLDL